MSRAIVVVHWLDASGCGEQENVDDVLREKMGVEKNDVGYVVIDNAEGIILSGTEFVGDDKSIDRRLTVPRPYVLDVKQMTVKRPKKVRQDEGAN